MRSVLAVLIYLVEISDFCQDLWLPAIPDPSKSTVLVKSLPRSPVRRIQMHEHLIPGHEACRRMKRERPAEFEQLTKSPSSIVSIILPTLFKSCSAGESLKTLGIMEPIHTDLSEGKILESHLLFIM